jgi:hypothetical protein
VHVPLHRYDCRCEKRDFENAGGEPDSKTRGLEIPVASECGSGEADVRADFVILSPPCAVVARRVASDIVRMRARRRPDLPSDEAQRLDEKLRSRRRRRHRCRAAASAFLLHSEGDSVSEKFPHRERLDVTRPGAPSWRTSGSRMALRDWSEGEKPAEQPGSEA